MTDLEYQYFSAPKEWVDLGNDDIIKENISASSRKYSASLAKNDQMWIWWQF